MKPESRFLALLLASLFCSACSSNPYAKHYNDATFGYSQARIAAIRTPQTAPKLIRVPKFEKVMFDEWNDKRGYIQLGFSEFTSAGRVPESAMVQQAKKIGAQYVFYSSSLSHTEAGVRPVVNYQPGQTATTFSTGNATAYAPGYGSAHGTYSGTSTTTTPGTFNTAYVPATITHVKYTAFYYADRKPEAMTAEQRRANGL